MALGFLILILAATIANGVLIIMHHHTPGISGAMIVSGTCHTDIPLKHRPREAWVDFDDDCPLPPSCNPQIPDGVTCEVVKRHHDHEHHWMLRISWWINSSGSRRIRWGTEGHI